MSRIPVKPLNELPKTTQQRLAPIESQLGFVPNMFKLIGTSPIALTAYTNFRQSLSESLDFKLRERISLAVAEVNQCHYCLSAHAFFALNVAKLSEEEVQLNRSGASADVKAHAAVRFAAKVARDRGHVCNVDINIVRESGFSDAQIIEIIALVSENLFTNYLNTVAQTVIDFPRVINTKLA